MLGFAGASFAIAFGSLVLAPNAWAAFPLLVVCGFGWTATVSTIISELQLFLPNWVRARAIAIYLMVFLGSQAVEDAAFAHAVGTPRTQPLLPPATPRGLQVSDGAFGGTPADRPNPRE